MRRKTVNDITEALQKPCNKVLGAANIIDGAEYRSGLILERLCSHERFTDHNKKCGRGKTLKRWKHMLVALCFCTQSVKNAS